MKTKDELRPLSAEELFVHRADVNDEIKRRAEIVLRASGYDWYKMNSISTVTMMRGKVTIVSIQASVEHNFQQEQYALEIPLTIFEKMSS